MVDLLLALAQSTSFQFYFQIIDFTECGYRLPPPSYCPRILHNTMLNCWNSESTQRPTFNQIVTRLEGVVLTPEKLQDTINNMWVDFVVYSHAFMEIALNMVGTETAVQAFRNLAPHLICAALFRRLKLRISFHLRSPIWCDRGNTSKPSLPVAYWQSTIFVYTTNSATEIL